MFLSLGRLGIGVNSAASDVRKTNLRVNLDLGGVRMPSMRTAVDNDIIGFEMEEADDDTSKKDKKKKEKRKEARHFLIKEQKEQ